MLTKSTERAAPDAENGTVARDGSGERSIWHRMIFKAFRKNPQREAALAAFVDVARQARSPAFYADLGAPDTEEGRFEMVTLHMVLLLRRLKRAGPEAEAFAQATLDAMFRNFDDNLRQMGVGDLRVPKRMKALAADFYGRLSGYDAALEGGDAAGLEDSLSRNVFAGGGEAGAPATLARYVRDAEAALAAQELKDIVRGAVSFPPPPEKTEESAS